MTTRRSVRYPWARGGLSGLLMLLTPFVWVVDVSSCGGNGPVQTELTGLALLGKFDLEWTSLVLLSMAFTVLTPFMALKVTRAAWESCVHVLGLVATGFFVWLGHMTMFFTLFTDRSPYGVGVLVLAVLLALLIDAGARLVFSVQQWRRAAVRAS